MCFNSLKYTYLLIEKSNSFRKFTFMIIIQGSAPCNVDDLVMSIRVFEYNSILVESRVYKCIIKRHI